MPDDHDDIRTLLTDAASDVPPFPPFPERTVRRARRRAAATVTMGAVVVCLVAALIVGVVVDRPRSEEGPAHTTRTKSEPKLVVVDIATGDARLLSGAPDDARAADVSPDGTKVAFVVARGGTRQVYVMGTDGSGLERVTHDPFEAGDPAWSPNGSMLAYVGFGRGATRSIFALDLATGGRTRLTHGPQDVYYPAWSHDGRRLLFMTDENQPNGGMTAAIYRSTSILDVATGGIDHLLGGAGSRSSVAVAAWSPVDDRIAFVASRVDLEQGRIVVLDSDSGARTDLTVAGDFAYVWGPVWSPDGSMIAFTATGADDDDPTGYVVPADGSAPPRKVTDGLWVEDWLSNDQLITQDPGEATS